MCSAFIDRLDRLVSSARSLQAGVRDREVYIIAGRCLNRDSSIFFPDGRHLFSCLDVVSLGAMLFVYQQLRSVRDVFLDVDSAGYSALHYAARYSFDDPFADAFRYASHFEETSLRERCMSSQNPERHSVASLLIERDRHDLLHWLLVHGLTADPFATEFEDVYFTWLHEAIFSDARGTAVYLLNTLPGGIRCSLERRPDRDPPELLSPFDVVLLRHVGCSGGPPHDDCSCSFFVDEILSQLRLGLRLHLFSYDHLFSLKAAGKLRRLTYTHTVEELVIRCLHDCIAWKTGRP